MLLLAGLLLSGKPKSEIAPRLSIVIVDRDEELSAEEETALRLPLRPDGQPDAPLHHGIPVKDDILVGSESEKQRVLSVFFESERTVNLGLLSRALARIKATASAKKPTVVYVNLNIATKSKPEPAKK